MKRNCNTCVHKEGSCYPSTTIFDRDKTCKSYTPDYEGYIAELEKENDRLSRKCECLTNNNESLIDIVNDVERLEQQILDLERENAELRKKCQDRCDECWEEHINLTKAKEIIRDLLSVAIDCIDKEDKNYSYIVEAEQFSKEEL